MKKVKGKFMSGFITVPLNIFLKDQNRKMIGSGNIVSKFYWKQSRLYIARQCKSANLKKYHYETCILV